MLLKIALRNIFRHKRRTLITVLVMSVGLMFFIFFDSLFVGIDKMLIEELIKYQDSSIVIYSKEYDEDKKAFPLDKPLKNIDKLINTISSLKDIESYTLRISFLGEIIFLDKSKYVIGTVIDPSTDIEVFNLKEAVKEGRFFNNLSEDEVLLGSNLAKELGIKVLDTITISAQTKYETHNALDFVVCGILETTIPQINESTVLINFSSAKKLLDIENEATSLHIKVPWYKPESIYSYSKRVSKIVEELKEKIDPQQYKIYSFRELYNDFILLMKQKRITSSIIIFFILLISAVGVVNTILMAVYERVKEIGVLMAMGFKSKQIRKLFLLEGAIIGVIGGVFGIILGFLLNLWLVYYGWNLEAFYGEQTTGLKASQLGMPVWGTIYGEWNIYAFIFCFCFALILAVVSAYFPARFASKLQVKDCLKFI